MHDETGYDCVLARGELTDETAALSLNLELRYAVASDGSLCPIPIGRRRSTDPPDIRRLVLWKGTSVTASGSVLGPPRPPFVRTASLAVGAAEHRVVVFGERRWVRRHAGALAPSEPECFEAVPLCWELAFGGQYTLAPGPDPSTGLPHPGGRVLHSDNPRGIGLYRDESAAEGQVLPQIERDGELVRSPSDRPRPGGLSPCPGLPALRLDDDDERAVPRQPGRPPRLLARWAEQLGPKMLGTAARLQHHAPAPLIFSWLSPGTAVRVSGVGEHPLESRAPAPPVRVEVRRGRQADELRGRLRSLHLDADRRELVATFGFSQRYESQAPPHWIMVRSEEAAR